jgi:cyclopropane fatty-acyl-phospholipid synthase-like methyltransferase
MDTSQSGIASTTRVDTPASDSVGTYYDHQIFDVMAQLGDGNLHYGYWLDENDHSTLEEAMEQMTAQMIRRLAPKSGDRILDVGCGNGTPALRLARAHDVEVVGISVSERQVARANERAADAGLADRVRFERVDAMDLPFLAESFDGAWAIESMFHMPDKAQVLSGVARVLRPGGRFPIADLIYRKPQESVSNPAFTNYTSAYASLTEFDDYARLVEGAGLLAVDVTDITPQTGRSVSCFADWMRSQRDRYVEIFGSTGFELLVANQEAMGQMSDLGYVMITTQRP